MSSALLNLAKRILRRAAEVGLEEAGTRLCGSAWSTVKTVISPVVEELERRFPKLLLVPDDLEKAENALSEDREAFESLLQERLTTLEEGHGEIMAVLVRHDETLKSYRDLIIRAVKEADEKDQKRHEKVIAEIAAVKTELSGLSAAVNVVRIPQNLSIDEIYKQANGYQMDAMKWISAKDAEAATQRLATARELAMGGLRRDESSARLLATLGFIEKTQAQVSILRRDPEGATENLALAEKYFAAALRMDRNNLNALNGMANVHYYGRDYDSAIQLGLAVINADPFHGPALTDLSLTLEAKIQESGPQPELVSQLIYVYTLLKHLMPLQPQLFPAAYLAYVQQRLAELRRIEAQPHREPGDSIVRVLPQFLALVIAEANPSVAMFNLNCKIVNQGSVRVSVQRMDAELTTPEGRQLQFRWNLFYDFRPEDLPESRRMERICDTQETEIEAEEGTSLGVQFVGPGLDAQDLWTPGEYKFELHARVSRQLGGDHFNIKTGFSVEIGAFEAGQMKWWAGVTKEVWDQLNDPDRAVAIPVRISA